MDAREEGDAVLANDVIKAGIRPEILLKMADVPLRRITIADAGLQPTTVLAHPAAGSGLDISRAGLRRIDFVAPEHVPSTSVVVAHLPEDVRRLCGKALDRSPAALEAALSALGTRTRGVPLRKRRSVATTIAADAPSDSDVHDLFFNIGRASTAEPALYVQSILETLIAFRQDLAETPVTVGAAVLARIETGLWSAVGSALGQAPRRATGSFTLASRPSHEDHPARRWIRGHQIFAALSQGLIAAMTGLTEANAAGPSQADAVRHIVIGLDACAAALEFTGDFEEHIYDALIRPSMCQPHAPRGFSGLLSADHMHLVRIMKEKKPAFEALRALDPEGHAAITAALARVYDSHKHVCSKFVGTERSSLLMASEGGRSSVEQLERFKTMRIRSLG